MMMMIHHGLIERNCCDLLTVDRWNVGFRIQMMLNVLNEGFSAQCRIQMVLNAQCNDSLAQ